MKPKARMGDAQHNAVSAELVRVTLGGKPDRPELLDWPRFAVEGLRAAVRRRAWKGRR